MKGRPTMAHPARGEIWLTDPGMGAGHEQFGIRPALVISDDAFNFGRSQLVAVLPLTSRVAKSRSIPVHVPIDPPDGGRTLPSVILCDQLRFASVLRLSKKWGEVAPNSLSMVEAVLRNLLAL